MPKRPMTTASPIDRTAGNMNEQSLPATSHEMIQEDYADDDFNEDEQSPEQVFENKVAA